MQLTDSFHHYFFNYFRYFNNLLHYSGYGYDFLNYFLYLDDARDFHYFLNNSVDKLGLNFHDLFFNNDRDCSLNFNGFDNFLSGWNNLNLFNFNFPDFFGDEGCFDLGLNWDFFPDVEGNNFLCLYIFGDQNFLEERFVDEDLNFPDLFFLITFDEVWTIDVDLLGNFPDKFFLNFKFNFNQFFKGIGDNNRFISIFCKLDDLYFRFFDLDRNFCDNFNCVLIFDDDWNCFLNLNQLGFGDNVGNSNLDWFYNLPGLYLWDNLFYSFNYFNQFLYLCLYYPFNLFHLNISDDFIDLYLSQNLLSFHEWDYLLDFDGDLFGDLDYSLDNDLFGGGNFNQFIGVDLDRNLSVDLDFGRFLDVDGDLPGGRVYGLLFLFEDCGFLGVERHAFFVVHGVVDFVFDDDGGFKVTCGWSEEFNDGVDFKIVALFLKHCDQSSIKGELDSMFLTDAHQFL